MLVFGSTGSYCLYALFGCLWFYLLENKRHPESWRHQQFQVNAEWLSVSFNECKFNLSALCGYGSVPSRKKKKAGQQFLCFSVVCGSAPSFVHYILRFMLTKCNLPPLPVSPLPGHKECWLGVVWAQPSHHSGAQLARGVRTESRGESWPCTERLYVWHLKLPQ